MRLPIIVMATCAILIVGGTLLAMAAPGIGAGLLLLGVVAFGVFVVYVYIRAWPTMGAPYNPGKAHREVREQREAAERAARQKR